MINKDKIKKYMKEGEYQLACEELITEIKLKFVEVMKKRGIFITTQTPMYEIYRITGLQFKELELVTARVINIINEEEEKDRLKQLLDSYAAIMEELEKYAFKS